MRRFAAAGAAAAAAATLFACGGEEVQTLSGEIGTGTGGGAEDDRAAPRRPPSPGATDAQVIRSWSRALNAGRYGLAADHFAIPSIVEQAREIRLPDRRTAIAFNRSLPCKGTVTDVDSRGGSTVAAFALRPGPGSVESCAGDARVRFVIEDGRIEEWRQLPGRAPGEEDVVRRRSRTGPS